MRLPFIVLLSSLLTASAGYGQAQTALTYTPKPIRGAHYPALSPDGKRLCFEYLGDLWTVPSEGGTATRLTLHRAYDAYPHWSPDGNWIAFSSNREGNMDVFLVPAKGGAARQITFHSADDIVQDWSPDGTQILFTSAREGRYSDLYTISLKDGSLHRLTNDRTGSNYGQFLPDGKSVVYTRGGQSWWRPKYKGSRNADLYLLTPGQGSAPAKTSRLTTYDGWDAFPLVAPDGRNLYYISEQGGNSNVWHTTLGSAAKPQPLTHQTGDAARFPSIARNGSAIAYEQNFQIWLLPLKAGTTAPRPIDIYAPADLRENVEQHLTLTNGANSFALAPDGKTIALAVHGDLWTIPAEGGDATQLTKTSAIEANPIWSPDGKTLIYTSTRNGKSDLFQMDVKSRVEKPLTDSPSDDTIPRFSPDGKRLAFVRGGGSEPGLYVLTLDTDAKKSPSLLRVGAGAGVGGYDWSPDGRWLVYGRRDATGTSDLWIVPSVGGTPINVTRYPGFNGSPQWARDGRHIVFLSNRGGDAGSSALNIYSLALLPLGTESSGRAGSANPADVEDGDLPDATMPTLPFFPDTNDHSPEAQRRRLQPAPQGQPLAAPGPQTPSVPGIPLGIVRRSEDVRIEFEDIQNRARALTNTRDPLGSLTLAPDARSVVYASVQGNLPGWFVVDLPTGSTSRLTVGGAGGNLEFAPDGSRFYMLGAGGALQQVQRGSPTAVSVSFRASFDFDRRAEVAEAFNEAWRTLKTRFYDPQMHGTDWNALRRKYEPLLAETVAKEDFAWLLSAMIGELNASHLGVTPAPEPGPSAATGYLGLSWDADYTGTGMRVHEVLSKGPAARVGRRIEPGEYLLAIDGQDVNGMTENVYKLLRDKVGRDVELLVNTKPTKEGARSIKITAISRAATEELEYEQWVETRRRKVDELSGGQLAYMHIKAMDQPSLQRFQRELFGDAQSKKGLVLDVRFNGGGRIHDDLLSLLARRPHVYEIPRDAEKSTQPFQLWNRPIILLINEYSASDAEIFPNGFRALGLGKIVGVPTYGAVIGTNNITLVDGTGFRIPRTGWYTLDGKNLENWGVPPDIRVEQTPEDNALDNDRQIEIAVRTLLKELK